MRVGKHRLIFGDCLEVMEDLIKERIRFDLILTDPPYGITACKWDSVIPLEPMWFRLKLLRKERTPIVLFGNEPFSSTLRTSNVEEYKYDWIWVKDKATNHLNCKKQPMRRTELISVFYAKQSLYNPQIFKKDPANIRPAVIQRPQTEIYGKMTRESQREIPVDMSYPIELLNFRSCSGDRGKSFHPTQKPVDLLEYLIKTYTNESDLVLDFTMGSGSTGVACQNLNRCFVGIEKELKYVEIAYERLLTSLKGQVK